MKTEEAAKEPKRKPKKQRAYYTQKQERQPGETNTTTTPKSRQSSDQNPSQSGAATDEKNRNFYTLQPRPKTEARQAKPRSPPEERRRASEKIKKTGRKTATDKKQHSTSPTESRNDHKPNKYTPKHKNAIQSEIIKPPTRQGQNPTKPQEPAENITFY